MWSMNRMKSWPGWVPYHSKITLAYLRLPEVLSERITSRGARGARRYQAPLCRARCSCTRDGGSWQLLPSSQPAHQSDAWHSCRSGCASLSDAVSSIQSARKLWLTSPLQVPFRHPWWNEEPTSKCCCKRHHQCHLEDSGYRICRSHLLEPGRTGEPPNCGLWLLVEKRRGVVSCSIWGTVPPFMLHTILTS